MKLSFILTLKLQKLFLQFEYSCHQLNFWLFVATWKVIAPSCCIVPFLPYVIWVSTFENTTNILQSIDWHHLMEFVDWGVFYFSCGSVAWVFALLRFRHGSFLQPNCNHNLHKSTVMLHLNLECNLIYIYIWSSE